LTQKIEERPLTPPEYNPTDKSCLKCAHRDVCVIYRFASRFAATEFEKDAAPFKPENMAKICKVYNPLQRIEMQGD